MIRVACTCSPALHALTARVAGLGDCQEAACDAAASPQHSGARGVHVRYRFYKYCPLMVLMMVMVAVVAGGRGGALLEHDPRTVGAPSHTQG